MQRPLTHDLFKTVLNTTDLKISRILINDLKENTFYAKIAIKNNGETIDIDSRPSDAVAIALRMKAPIFVASQVIDKAAVNIDDENQYEISDTSTLKEQLEKAIESEDYENAAILRDKLKGIKGKNGNGPDIEKESN